MSRRARASVSLDLDNKWSYLKTHGEDSWRDYPSYLDVVVPRILDFLDRRGQRITFFIVGRDAEADAHRDVLASIAEAGHEIGNHSFSHEPWFHLYSDDRIHDELARTEDALEARTGVRPRGFRGPGFSVSTATLEALDSRGYRYDASTLPTFLGPLARAYYLRTTQLDEQEKRERARLFGTFAEGLRPLKPYRWRVGDGSLVEVPVTTAPLFKTPIHLSYLIYLHLYQKSLPRAYFASALTLCRAFGVAPSLLLHPLDFLGPEDEKDLGFFPAMSLGADVKMELVDRALDSMAKHWDLVAMDDHVASLPDSLPQQSFD